MTAPLLRGSAGAVRRNAFANLAGQAWTAFMAVVFVPIYIHYLGVEAYGVIGLFTLLQAWLAFLDMGITPTLNREMARYAAGAHTATSIGNLLRTLEVLCGVMAVALVITTWTVSGYVASAWLDTNALSVSTVARAIALMGVVAALRLCEAAYRGALLGLQRQVFFNAVNALMATLRFGGVVGVLAFVSNSIAAFFVWQALVSLVTVVILAGAVWRTVGGPTTSVFTTAALREVGGFARGMLVITALGLLLTQVDKILLSRMISLEGFGYYSLAATVAGILFFAVGPITFAVYPELVALSTRGDQEALATTYHRGAQLVVSLVAPAGFMLVFFAERIIHTWSGDPVLAQHTATLLSILALGTILNTLMYMPVHLQLAHAWTSLSVRVNLVAVLTVVPMLFWVVPRFGAAGAAWVWVGLNAAYVAVGVQLMHRRLLPSEKRRWYLNDTAIPLAGALAIVLVASWLRPSVLADRLVWTLFFAVTALLAVTVTALLADHVRPAVLDVLHIRGRGGVGRA